MEEKIYDRQISKLSLACRVVDEQQVERHFNQHDVEELYEFEPDRKRTTGLIVPKVGQSDLCDGSLGQPDFCDGPLGQPDLCDGSLGQPDLCDGPLGQPDLCDGPLSLSPLLYLCLCDLPLV